MPFPIAVMMKLGEAHDLVRKGQLAEAAALADALWNWAERAWEAFDGFEALEFLGAFASLLRTLDQTTREIRVLERLCTLAERHLDERGLMAGDDDIRYTGMDFVQLGLAYRKDGRVQEARAALEKGKDILAELGWLVEVDKLLNGEPTTIGPSPLVEKRPYQPKPAESEKARQQQDARSDFAKRMTQTTNIAVAHQIAKVLFMDDVTADAPVEPRDPLERVKVGEEEAHVISEVLRAHRIDCEICGADVPLVIGVPVEFAAAVRDHLNSCNWYGLSPHNVRVFPEPEAPFFDAGGDFVTQGSCGMRTHLRGGGASLAQLVESGVLSDLWKRGIRWLMIGQVVNLGARLEPNMLRHIPGIQHEGFFEVVEREALPSSLLLALRHDDKNICVDDRRLRSPQHAELRSTPYVGTGTFWVSCEALAKVFGVTSVQLESEWNPKDPSGMFDVAAVEKIAIMAHAESGLLGMTIPPWEVLQSLDLEGIRVGPERASLFNGGHTPGV